ncbi:MAG: YbhB/YbcL family Raf kinase inhibitor-like protein [Verrucomicrobia bacterium]|nr:YbhB/YbcL family Raf kinase inhibitor-like protein [Verrucomicrobiota bacterium]MBU1909450.1 YbhB/YbcL family Raf kinase inhibitor-like protein [Verrucomicrobiota bacterium]
MLELTVLSAAFVMGAAIPPRQAGGGDNLSPPLSWSQVPEGTRSIAVLCDDPDAPVGDWVHWVLFNLPPDTAKLEEGIPAGASLPNGAMQGVNDYSENGYHGPWPPPGRPHRYVFKVYALNLRLNLTPAARKKDLLKAMQGHVLAQGQLTGILKR